MLIPLYSLQDQSLSEAILEWQQNWQACDLLQMNGNVLECHALAQISDETSVLATIGRDLCQQIEQRTHIPTFYYLYRLGRDEGEYQRKCPCCGGE